MDNIKKNFSIRDLENISGIKAHTIRIWEKRYNLFSPERSKTNIRYYSHQNLQKLLNIVLLNNNNYKISKISKMSTYFRRFGGLCWSKEIVEGSSFSCITIKIFKP